MTSWGGECGHVLKADGALKRGAEGPIDALFYGFVEAMRPTNV